MAPSSPQRILVIDDSFSIRKLLSKILQLHHYEVLAAATAEEGIKLALEQAPDLVICDVNLPDHDGYYVLERLRENEHYHFLPFIFVSGEAIERQDVRKGMTHGADDYLFKPFTPGELVEAVDTRLKRHALLQNKITRKSASAPLFLQSYARLEADLQSTIEEPGQVLFSLDIDRFKRLNDVLGFKNADEVLHKLMYRFEAIVDHQYQFYHGVHVGQMIVLGNEAELESAQEMARKLMHTISEPLDFQTYQLHLTCSVGIYICDPNCRPPDALKRANIALNQAKQQGGNMFTLYQQDMHTTVTRKLTWENELHQAITHRWFVLHYQPQIDLISGEVTGVEALIRMQHPELGLIYPGEFIQIAEESGLIAPMGDWCLRAACKQIKEWHAKGFSELRMSVNVSVLQFKTTRFVSRIAEILKEADLDGRFLEIELTESALVSDLQSIQSDLEKLHELNVTLAIDDFGTGYSSLSYLRHLPFDLLKIDQSFVRSMTDSSASLAIPKAIIDMGHSMGLEILAEGIETKEQLMLLKSYGCDLGQGYYMSKPIPADALEAFLNERAPV